MPLSVFLAALSMTLIKVDPHTVCHIEDKKHLSVRYLGERTQKKLHRNSQPSLGVLVRWKYRPFQSFSFYSESFRPAKRSYFQAYNYLLHLK